MKKEIKWAKKDKVKLEGSNRKVTERKHKVNNIKYEGFREGKKRIKKNEETKEYKMEEGKNELNKRVNERMKTPENEKKKKQTHKRAIEKKLVKK